MGFVTFPREWEGLHEAFPEYPAQYDNRSPLVGSSQTVLIGAAAGVAFNLARAMQRRPLPLAVLNGIGLVTIPMTGFVVFTHERARSEVKSDVKAILQAENITLPPRKFIKFTPGSTSENTSAMTGLLAVTGLSIYRRAPNFPKAGFLAALGIFTVGQLVGSMSAQTWNDAVGGPTLIKYHISCVKASQIFSERTRKPPPRFLYGSAAPDAGKGGPKGHMHDPFGILRGEIGSEESHPGLALLEQADSGEIEPLLGMRPEPPGAYPHVVMRTGHGENVPHAQRDYEWNPPSTQTGLETLQDHMVDLNRVRAQYVKRAEYLWNIIARREAQKYPPYGREDDKESVILERKALELLTSIHKQVYSQIADLDWCIANTKKLMLQFQSDGKWLPNGSGSAVAKEVRDKVLSDVRRHKKNLEVQKTTVEETLEVMPGPEEQKTEIRQAISENLAATAQLLKDLENDASEDE